MQTKRFLGVAFSIDRPKGFVKRWKRPDGSEKVYTYPVDYGFFPNLLADDGEGLDAFVGNSIHGHFESFEKLKPDGAKWVHDEFKFLVGLTDPERAAVYSLYPSHEVNARRIYPDFQTLVKIAHALASPAHTKAAVWASFGQRKTAVMMNPYAVATSGGLQPSRDRRFDKVWDDFEQRGAAHARARLS